MTPERWRLVTEIFHNARACAPERRAAFVVDACRGDANLQQEIETMLRGDDAAAQFGEAPLFASPSVHEMPSSAPIQPQAASVHEMALELGTSLGPYEIVAVLGVGGMGEVYRAHDTRLQRDVAIKTLPPGFVDSVERVARFRGEARMLAALNHPRIAAIYGLEQSGRSHHLVMELVEGEVLKGPLAVDKALDYAKQVAEALEAAHARGIIHRDIKPANVKVAADGGVKVLDFGLAKFVLDTEPRPDPAESNTATVLRTLAGHIVGSPAYMSPEQARGNQVDERTDIWAFGCLLYELLSGRQAFQGDTPSDIMAAVLKCEPDWTALPAATPAKIRELLRRCLDKDGATRLQSIAEARSIIEHTRRKSNPWQVGAIAAAVLAAAAISVSVGSRDSAAGADFSEWIQITRLPDSVSQPALSRDGQKVAFVRGSETFFGPGQVYVKTLPDGEPIQLTHDGLDKMSPVFSPDGARIAYTTVDTRFGWDTWIVPVAGGEPTRWLRNASGLVWDGLGQMLFAEINIKKIPHMGIVRADEHGRKQRDVYWPAHSQCHGTPVLPVTGWKVGAARGNGSAS